MSKLSKEELLEWLEDLYNEQFIVTGWKEDKDEQAYHQIKELIQKPEVTEEWIEEKARAMCDAIDGSYAIYPAQAENFIRSLVEEISSQQLDKGGK